MGVVIPARNKEDRIVACLHSVRSAIDSCRLDNAWIVVVADSCTDDTAARAQAALQTRGCVIQCLAGSSGAARRLGVSELLAAVPKVDRAKLWLANTDADTCVPRDSLANNCSSLTREPVPSPVSSPWTL